MRRISTRRAADVLGNLVAEMAARRHAARVICVHNTVARRPIGVRIWMSGRSRSIVLPSSRMKEFDLTSHRLASKARPGGSSGGHMWSMKVSQTFAWQRK